MQLSLTVIGPQAEALGERASVCWMDAGGTIGRAPNNDWTLPDPQQEISRCHARIRFVGGAFYLEDTSANGTFVGDRNHRVGSRELHRLEDGQHLFIGDYEIRVAIFEADAADARGTEPAGRAQEEPGDADALSAASQEMAPPDPLELLGGSVEPPEESAPPPAANGAPPYLEEHFRPAPVHDRPEPGRAEREEAEGSEPATGGQIPTDWWRESGPANPDSASQSPSAPAAPESADGAASGQPDAPSPPPASSAPRPRPGGAAPTPRESSAGAGGVPGSSGMAAHDDALAALLSGAGLDPSNLTEETAETLGRLLRIAVEGMMDLLRARMEVKNEFRMPVTLIQATDNNPLKFSTDAEDALHNLLVKRNPDYLGPEDAFRASFDDLRLHQMALLAGMREAFFAMLERFEPDHLESLFAGRQGERPVLGRVVRRRPWEQYREMFREIRQDTEGYFNRLFGEAFVDAYERQMQELKSEVARRRRG
ncbi:type VI secretion system-associated FHA domain protein TagH [Sediminicurvatus halobius]|uniref:Type VI secretion system-associated FHA domain protein TagH n=1 Tax=Sediminicurvatus halobius TaxID=2182432 RepID=A0A2U2N2J5_9GAMM|nr:type VI secretion system-associated FHA domain protein TagH [Spiribacter halobius]PWG63268.1 type VI secretion system-associated FHA domain protein TagH [Spiribacter halobius]UEX76659.1 type VI secretion system-associated FHA domain protein TagH [Spiribacter halobius]